MTDNPPNRARRPETLWPTALAVFGVAWLARTLFAGATGDASWPHSISFKGDAFVWLRSALAQRAGEVFESDLPLRPPGMTWLIGLLWDGTPGGVAELKALWRVGGAATAAVLYRVLARDAAHGVAVGASLLFAVAGSALCASSSLNNETPYLLVVLLSLWARLPSGSASRAFLVGLLDAAACLLRAEHALFVVLMALVGARSFASEARSRWGRPVCWLLAFVSVLAPWQAQVWSQVTKFNSSETRRTVASERALVDLENRIRPVRWTNAALAEIEALPRFARRSARAFVAATARHRGQATVDAEDVGVLEEAFGSRPAALNAFPFVTSYGPLAFRLANHPRGGAGFSLAALSDPPPLEGGAERYPPELIEGLPPVQLSFEYAPHLEVFNHGYAAGWAWIVEQPGAALSRIVRKLDLFWRGAAPGLGGFALPVGASGVRRAVDLATPEGPGASVWRACIALLAAFGLAVGRREVGAPARRFLVLFAVSRVLVTAAFFGYARHGVLLVPVVALAVALAVRRLLAGRRLVAGHDGRRASWLLWTGCLALLAAEAFRSTRGVRVELDGVEVEDADPFSPDVHVDRTIEFSLR